MRLLKSIVLCLMPALLAGMPLAISAEIRMKSLSYDPKQLEITQGDSVSWKNVSLTDHSATSEATPPAFDTGMVEPGKQSPPIHFDKAGRFVYHCMTHGKTMSGVVIVKAAHP